MTESRPTIEALQLRYPGATTFRFGDSESLSDLLLSLVRSGKKTATCGALRDFATETSEVSDAAAVGEPGNPADSADPADPGDAGDGDDDELEPMPVVGRRDIALEWDGRPALVIETTEVTIRRFCNVDADFALAEGENDSLDGWQADHRAFFERNGGWQPDLELVCEHFRLIEDFARSSD